MSNGMTVVVDGSRYRTLRDLLPAKPGLRALFVGKTPAPLSVEQGHYFQGTQGKAFWRRLKDYDLLCPTTAFEDDSMVAHGFGLTDMVKLPRAYGCEPSDAEYGAGAERILKLIREHKPEVVVFVYKKVAEQLLRCKFGVTSKAVYGFNATYSRYLHSQVFAFPLPGVGGCSRDAAHAAMTSLRLLLGPRAPRSRDT